MQAVFSSPIGWISLTEEKGALIQLAFTKYQFPLPPKTPLLQEAIRQLTAYFSGTLQQFSLPLSPKGTPFQLRVWQGLQSIPYGQTISYGQLAERIDHPKACRAVGTANGKNPLPILIPCHRVISADGSLGGYSAGKGIKERLLALEGIAPWAENPLYNIRK